MSVNNRWPDKFHVVLLPNHEARDTNNVQLKVLETIFRLSASQFAHRLWQVGPNKKLANPVTIEQVYRARGEKHLALREIVVNWNINDAIRWKATGTALGFEQEREWVRGLISSAHNVSLAISESVPAPVTIPVAFKVGGVRLRIIQSDNLQQVHAAWGVARHKVVESQLSGKPVAPQGIRGWPLVLRPRV